MLFVGANLNEVKNNCPGTASPACVVKEEELRNNQTSYTTGDVLSPGTVYFWKVVNYKDADCSKDARTKALSSCLDAPKPLTVNVGSTVVLNTRIYTDLESQIAKVNYSTTTEKGVIPVCNPLWPPRECQSHQGCIPLGGRCIGVPHSELYPNAVSLNPTSDTTLSYLTRVTGVRSYEDPQIRTTIYSSVYFNGEANATCQDTVDVNVLPAEPWWQVKDADVQTNGDLRSKVPSGYYFGLPGLGGFPGVARYEGSTNLDSAKVSDKGWLAESAYAPPNNKIQDYSYFRRSENRNNLPTYPSLSLRAAAGGEAIPLLAGRLLRYARNDKRQRVLH